MIVMVFGSGAGYRSIAHHYLYNDLRFLIAVGLLKEYFFIFVSYCNWQYEGTMPGGDSDYQQEVVYRPPIYLANCSGYRMKKGSGTF